MSRITLAWAVYGALAMVAVLWRYWVTGDPTPYYHPEPWFALAAVESAVASLVIGVAVAIAIIASTRVFVRRSRWARGLHREFRALLCPLSRAEIASFALSSGIGEELFFRGAMQVSWGLLISGFLFGIVHVGPNRRFLPWTIWAIGMGWIFGAMYVGSGCLLGPVVAHVMINWINLQFIRDVDLDFPFADP